MVIIYFLCCIKYKLLLPTGCAGGKAARTLLPAVYPGKGCAHSLVGRSDITRATACAMHVALVLIQKITVHISGL